jgi:hypothetical protein
LNRLSHGIRVTVMLAAVAISIAGCAESRTGNGAQASGETPYHTSYGMTSDGPTTDVYTEIFGGRETANAAPTALPPPQQQQAQPVTAATPIQQAQPATGSPTNRQRTAASSAKNRQAQPAPAPVPAQVAQQPAPPQPPPEPDTPAAYGMTSNGPTTDLFTELFGPRRRDGQ